MASSPLRLAAAFCGMVVLLLFLWMTREILVTVFISLLFAASIIPIVDRLERMRVPRGLGAALVVLIGLAVLGGVGAMLAPTLQEQSSDFRKRIPEAVDRVGAELSRRHIDVGSPSEIFSRQAGRVAPYLFPFFSTTFSALAGLILVVFLVIFFAADPGTYKRGVLHLVPRDHRGRANEVMVTIGHSLRAWMMARSIAMVTVGLVVTGVMALLGVRAFVALGIIAGLLEFVPVFGPILGAIPAIALALADSPQKALWVAIAFLVIQQLEGNLLIPMLLQKAVEVPPALTLIGISAMVIVLGVLGLLIAEPLVAAMLVMVKMLYVEPVIGDKT